MSRSKEFDPTEALHQTMYLFWQKGYINCSIDDVVQTTGVSRYGLYSTFGDKDALFIKALKHYSATIINTLLAPLEAETASLADIRHYFVMVLRLSQPPSTVCGCFIANTAAELGKTHPIVAGEITQHYQRLYQAFLHALFQAQQKNEIPASLNVPDHASFLIGIANGLLVGLYAGFPQAQLEVIVAVALAKLTG